ncbi:MAG: transposase [Aquificaceae bacterium]
MIDESGFMLQPLACWTWVPKGRTPILYIWACGDRLSGIAALTVSPKQKRLGLYFQIYRYNIRSEQVFAFLTWLRRHLGRKFILVLDKCIVHRKAVRLFKARYPEGLEVERLPAYAPDLNPVEMVWNYTKYAELANFIAEDLDELEVSVSRSLGKVRAATHLLGSFFRHARLEL